MAYFGNSYRGQGDPGFFSALRKIGGAAVRTGVGFVTGGPAGAIAANIPGRQLLRETRSGAVVPSRGGFIAPTSGFPGVGRLVPETARMFVPSANGTGGCPQGFHLNKSDYWTKQGFVPKGSKCVRNRSRNPYNRRAASRAASRLGSLARGMKTIRKSVGRAARELK